MAAPLAVIHSPPGKRARAKVNVKARNGETWVIAPEEPGPLIAPEEPDRLIGLQAPDPLIGLQAPDPVIALPALARIASATGRFSGATGRRRTIAPSEEFRAETRPGPIPHKAFRAWDLLAVAPANSLAEAVAPRVVAVALLVVAVALLVVAVEAGLLVAAVEAAEADAEAN